MAGRAAGRAAGRVGEMENKAISASNLKLKLKLTEAELGNDETNHTSEYYAIAYLATPQ